MSVTLLTTEELVAGLSLAGRRPDAVLRRLREQRLLPRPTRHGLGQGRGTEWRYPVWARDRLAYVLTLRRAGVRSARELRWWCFAEGDDRLWEDVRGDLLAAWREADMAHPIVPMEQPSLDVIDGEAVALATTWRTSRRATYDRRKVRKEADVTTLAWASLGAALGDPGGLSVGMEDPVDDVGATVGELVDRAWGSGSGPLMRSIEMTGVGDARTWRGALEEATLGQARVALELLRVAIEQHQPVLPRDSVDRALLMGALLAAVRALKASPP